MFNQRSFKVFTTQYFNLHFNHQSHGASYIPFPLSWKLLHRKKERFSVSDGWWAHEHKISSIHSFPNLQQLQGQRLLSQYESKANPVSSHSIVLAWSRIAFMLIKAQSQKMKNTETSRRISQQFCAFPLNSVSPEWELKLESFLSGRKVAASQTPVTSKGSWSNEWGWGVKRLSVLMKMLYTFFVKKGNTNIMKLFLLGTDT